MSVTKKFEHMLKNTIHEVLDIKCVELTPEKVVLTMPVGPKTWQPYGLLHGGASVVLAESAASIGTALNVDPKQYHPAGIEINANHIKSKKDGLVKAVAVPLHRGRTTMVWDIRIVDEEEALICVSRCTVAVIRIKQP